MLEHYVRYSSKLRKLQNGPFSEVLEPLAEWLHRHQYSQTASINWFRRIALFHQWFRDNGCQDEQLEYRHIDQYLAQCPVRISFPCGRREYENGRRSTFPVALALLEEKKFGQTGTKLTKIREPSSIWDEFRTHMRDNCALSKYTIQVYLVWCRRLHLFAFGSPNEPWRPLKPPVVLDFVQQYVQLRSATGNRLMLTSIKKYFRYLQLQGYQMQGLLETLPRVKGRAASPPERILTAKQRRLWLDGFDRSRVVGRRDYTMALCLSDLGMRVGDLAKLCLDDLDWRKSTVRIPNSKQKRSYWLPLPSRVGKAIATYIRHDRPKSDLREVFLRDRPPYDTPLITTHIRTRLQGVAIAQGLPRPLTGTHALRHTVATEAYESGASLKEVADMLGHESIRTTTKYVKLSRRELVQVVASWPEELS